jgi:hypothetical protein
MTHDLVDWINDHDLLIFTGCTILQDHPGHQQCFNEPFREIRVRKICFGAGFCCALDARPSLRIARLFDEPIAARDPWTAEYLTRAGISNRLVGCPTLLEETGVTRWMPPGEGRTLVSSTPELDPRLASFSHDAGIRYVSHEASTPGWDLNRPDLFEDVGLVITGRLHLALPAIAQGIPVRFYGPQYWRNEATRHAAGPSRFSLLNHLGQSIHGDMAATYPAEQIREFRTQLHAWFRSVG